MSEKMDEGKIIVRKNKKGKWVFEVDLGGKQPMTIPGFYDLKDDSWNGKKCEVVRENGQIVKISVDGKELSKKQQSQTQTQSQTHARQQHRGNDRQNRFNSYQKDTNFNFDRNGFDINKAKIPKDTREKLKNIDHIDNFNLLLNKFAQFDESGGKGKFYFYKTDRGEEIYKISSESLNLSRERYLRQYGDKLKKLNLQIRSCVFKPDWRLVVGLGNESVYEISITLHHIYGFPYIPGSAVKGVARSYFIKTEFEKAGIEWEQINIFENVLENLDLEKDKKLRYGNEAENRGKVKGFKDKFSEKERLASEKLYNYFYEDSYLKDEVKDLIEKFRTIFGTQTQRGKVIFFDAYPKTNPQIKVDVMNPHYGDYYGSKNNNVVPPADYLSPNPIYFLTVENTEFEFFVGVKNGVGGKYLSEVEALLQKALEEHGIGAKTAVGYGYMGN